jgi:hypothetical protein
MDGMLDDLESDSAAILAESMLRIEDKLDSLLALLEHYKPLLVQAEKRLTPKFGGKRSGR